MQRNTITCSDVLDYLRSLPVDCVDCVITSPPYWSQRDYSANGQIGREETFEMFLAKLVDVFLEVKRVMKPTANLYVNMGDKYIDKQLLGQPWQLAFALQANGYILREDIVWHKPNPMPGSQTDRCTTAHEYIFHLTKRAQYWYDQEAVRESNHDITGRGQYGESGNKQHYKNNRTHGHGSKPHVFNNYRSATSGRNKRTVWSVDDDFERVFSQLQTFMRELGIDKFWEIMNKWEEETGGIIAPNVWQIATESFKGAHYATFPQKLVEPCLLAGCPREVCAECGAPVDRVVEREKSTKTNRNEPYAIASGKGERPQLFTRITPQVITTGWTATCDCKAGTRPGLVLDPFMGSGTVALVAIRHERDYIGCDISSDYVSMAQKRIADFDPYQPVEHETGEVQLSLFGG